MKLNDFLRLISKLSEKEADQIISESKSQTAAQGSSKPHRE